MSIELLEWAAPGRLALLQSILLWTLLPVAGLAQVHSVSSPDGETTLRVNTEGEVSWSVSKYGTEVLPEITSDVRSDDTWLAENARLRRIERAEVDEDFEVILPVRDRTVNNRYNALTLIFSGKLQLEFRLYNEGVAWRFVYDRKGTWSVQEEKLEITFPDGTTSHFPLEESTYSHNERTYIPVKLDTLDDTQFASLPVLFTTGSSVRMLFSEADVFDYPQLFLKGGPGNTLHAMHPPVVAEAHPEEGPGGDRNQVIVREESFIARADGPRTLPWRFFVITREDRTLLSQHMVMQLSRDLQLDDTSWIRPGKVAWDWWNANNLHGVDFEAGLNTQTYKYYIDFAAEHGIEYVILDEGWTLSTVEILDFNPDIDVPELIRYGDEKGVGIILWCLWKPLHENMEETLDTYAGWGARGIKVDFMQRSDLAMTRSYEAIAKACAERKLLVDFHGAFKPGGLRKAYPNIISYEGVKGNEHLKWSHDITPTHNTTIPFIRMAVGPMDFTPGALRNFHINEHYINFDRPASIGTRAHQVALYTVFESPIQMLCDAPTAYEEEPETTDFIVQVPTTWDETRPLDGRVGEYVAVARRHGEDWFVAAITNEEARELQLDFSFLPAGEYETLIFRDGLNAARHAEDYQLERTTFNAGSTRTIQLAGGGGWSAILRKK